MEKNEKGSKQMLAALCLPPHTECVRRNEKGEVLPETIVPCRTPSIAARRVQPGVPTNPLTPCLFTSRETRYSWILSNIELVNFAPC